MFALALAFALAVVVLVLSGVLELWRVIKRTLTEGMFFALSVVLPNVAGSNCLLAVVAADVLRANVRLRV